MRYLGLCLVVSAAPTLAAPPPEGPLLDRLKPHKDWIEGQWRHCHNPPSDLCYCCNVADGRPVEAEQQRDGHWRAHVTPEMWPGAPDKGEDMPREIEVPDSPFMFEGFLWRSPKTGQNYCFAPPAGGV
jgi:hypothetical protein